ncbi:D-alanine--D-alanine ligase [Candidatus Uhrbacteria bacterium]|nr:D-alanine--D-alanine ligase [Candidatus Uhrbacteria bacterium]
MNTPSPFIGKTVGVFFGGKSPEHDVSIITGLLVLDELAKLGILSEPIYIGTDGAWCMGQLLRERSFLQGIHSHDLYPLQRWSLDTRHRTPRLILTRRPSFLSRREQKIIDIAFPVFHGAYGEDGCFQGLCETLGVPYVGCGVEGSAIAMNKILTKQFFQQHGVQTTPFVGFSEADWKSDANSIKRRINETLTFPVFVKPSHAGSSIGISRVKKLEAIEEAIEASFEFDTHCVIESGISPVRDLTCCVRECASSSPKASLVQDSSFGKSEFFTYKEKYLQSDGTHLDGAGESFTIPAEIPVATSKNIQETSVAIFKELGLSGISRVDFLYNPETSQLYANEINPMPGTLYEHLWKKSGVEPKELILDLLDVAIRKHTETIKKNKYFHSPLLSDMQGQKLSK